MRVVKPLALGIALALPAATSAYADSDSSAKAQDGFRQVVEHSDAVMIRVPIDSQGRENTDDSEMRVVSAGGRTTAPSDYQAAWNTGVKVDKKAVKPSSGANSDSSTSYYYGWNNWYGYGWNYNYYYNYRPYYSSYYYGSPYNYYYSNPYYYSYYNYNNYYPYYGYRYYWYSRGW